LSKKYTNIRKLKQTNRRSLGGNHPNHIVGSVVIMSVSAARSQYILSEWLAHYIVRSALIIYSITSASRPNVR